jgi:hypothetical protein
MADLNRMAHRIGRVHESLAITDESGKTVKRTPAMAAGVNRSRLDPHGDRGPARLKLDVPRYADRVQESRPHLGARGDVNAGDRAADATARAQHLVDSRPKGAYPLAWCIEAMHVGDLTAIAALQLSDTLLGPN